MALDGVVVFSWVIAFGGPDFETCSTPEPYRFWLVGTELGMLLALVWLELKYWRSPPRDVTMVNAMDVTTAYRK
jgi:hypothetical protein